MTINKFRGDYFFLSNFYPCSIFMEGKRYPSVEHAYQASKTLDPESREKIRQASSAAQAKQLGRSVKVRPDWKSLKIPTMRKLVEYKFRDEKLADKLVSTSPEEIVEENNWGDRVWGMYKGGGQNLLGRILMKIRRDLIDERNSTE